MSKIKDRLMAKSMATPAGTDKVRAIVDGVDHLATEMEARWGVGRLRLLVSDDYRERFDRQRRKFGAAIWEGAPAEVEVEGERMRTAWAALDAQARDLGQPELDSRVWEVALEDGKVAALVRTGAEQHAVSGDGRYVMVFTLKEIARLITGFPELALVKQAFPGALVEAVRPVAPDDVDWTVGDELPELA